MSILSILSQRLGLGLVLYLSLGALGKGKPGEERIGSSLTKDNIPSKSQEKDLKKENTNTIYIEEALDDFREMSYHKAVEAALTRFETERGAPLVPGPKGKIGLKPYTYSGPGLCTPLPLLRGLILALEKRGFTKEGMMIVDFHEKGLRHSGILPPLSDGGTCFEGVPVYALDTDRYWDPEWFYENNLPSLEYFGAYLKTGSTLHRPLEKPRILVSGRREIKEELQKERMSYLNPLLLCDVDGWINLPMLTSQGAIGVSGALANATLLNMSNHKRFLTSASIAPMVVAELAAIPEMGASWLFTLLSLECYQYVGDYQFNANYTQSEPLLLLSTAPAALDYALLQKLNYARLRRNFPPLGDKNGLFWAYLRELKVP